MNDAQANLERIAAGPMEALFSDGGLRYVRVGDVEVVRRVHVAVRDTAWGTVNPSVSDLQITREPRRFEVNFNARHACDEIDFRWTGKIVGVATTDRGAAESSLLFEMKGVAERTFRTCRTGMCLLHPLRHCAGAECSITHLNGRVEVGRLPDRIAPWQPFSDIVGMSQSFPGGLGMKIEFQGDVFETEDQRNWTDGSFKTYCRPLSMPFPYLLERGQRVSQSITITVAGVAPNAPAIQSVKLGSRPVGEFPGVGLVLNELPSTDDRARLRRLSLSHLRVDIRLADSNWRLWFLDSLREAKALGLAVEVAIHVDADCDAKLAELARLAERSSAEVRRWIVYEPRRPTPSAETLAMARRRLTSAQLGCGTIGSFAELNRRPPSSEDVQVIAYSINPQVHATDDLTLIENLEAQPDTVWTARSVAPGAAVAVGPVTLHRRPDPFAAGKSGEEEPAQADERQRTMFGAAWTLGSIAALCRSAPDAMTYYDVTGPFGVMEGGKVFPLYHVLAEVGEFAGGETMECGGVDPLKGTALALRKGHRVRLIIAGFGGDLALNLAGLEPYRMAEAVAITPHGVRPINTLAQPFAPAPFSIVRIDLELKGGPNP